MSLFRSTLEGMSVALSTGCTICLAIRKGRPGPRLKKICEMVKAVLSSSCGNQRKARSIVPQPRSGVEIPLSTEQMWQKIVNCPGFPSGSVRKAALKVVPRAIAPLATSRAVFRDFLMMKAEGMNMITNMMELVFAKIAMVD